MTLKAIDGSSVKLEDTEANQLQYPQPCQQAQGCGFPVMGITGLLNFSHGGWDAFTTATLTTHDATMAWGLIDLIDHIEEGDLLLADRVYCSFAYIAKLLQKGARSVIRLHQKREAALDWNQGEKVSSFERIVRWKRPVFSNQNTGMNKEQWEALPEQLSIRLIRLGCEDRSGERKNLTIATTLTDHQRFDGLELHTLYARRWEIELKLRDIKTTIGFEVMRVKSPEMTHKTLKVVQLSYNLIRIEMKRSIAQNDLPPETLSFKESLGLVNAMSSVFRRLGLKPKKLQQQCMFLLDLMATKKLNYRPFRSEPRAIKRRPKPYALLTKYRDEYTEITHRSRYCANA